MENELIQKLLDINPDAAFIAGREDGSILFCNEAFIKISGIKKYNISIYDIIVSPEKEKLIHLFKNSSGRECLHFNFGNHKPLEFDFYSVSFNQNSVLCTLCNKTHPTGNPIQDNMFDKLNDAVITTDVKGNITTWNKGAERIYGWNEAEAVGKKVDSLTCVEISESDRKLSKFEIEKKGNSRMIISQRHRNGTPVFIDSTTSVLQDITGKVTGFFSVNHDITSKLKTQEKLKKSEGRYEQILNTFINNLPLVLLELDNKGTFIFQQGKALANVGFQPGELVGQSAFEVLGNVMLTRDNGEYISVKNLIPKVMKGEVVAGYTTMHGRHYDNYFVPLWNDEGNVTGLLGVCLDISERIKLEKSSFQAEKRFRLIAENTSDLISMVSNHEYLYLSPSYEIILGYTPEEIKKLGPLALVHPDDKLLLRDWRTKGMLEFRVKNKNGDWLWMEGESFSILGDPEIVVGIARDITKRKLAQLALEESKERYRILFEKNPLPMFVYDEETYQFLAVNKAAIDHYGYTEDEFLKMSIMDIRPNADVPAIPEIFQTQKPGLNKFGIWKHILKNGYIINVDVTAHPIIFNERRARIVLANDVTAKVKAEKALIESEQKYRMIVENANEGIWLFDSKWNTTFANKKLGDILGYKVKEIEDKSVMDFIYNADKAKAGKYFHKIRKGGRETIKLRLQHKDRSERWIISNTVSIYDDSMNYTGALALITDITGEKKAQEIIQKTNEMLKALINSSPLSIIILDKEGATELWNPASEQMFGWKSDEVLGIKPPIVSAEKNKEGAFLRKTVLRGNSFTGMEVSRVKKDGSKIDVSMSASPLFDSNKKPIGIASFLMDITERKLAEKEREKLFRQIDNARKRLKVLSSKLISVQENEKRNISRELHDEIGQILTAIKIDLERVKTVTASDETCFILDDCTSLVERTISVIRNLSHELRPAIIDDLGLASALKWYTDKFSKRTGISVGLDAQKVDKFLPSESAITLFRICQEALTNVAKHSHADYVSIKIVQKKRIISLSVEDNGCGFDTNKALRLAEKGDSLGLLSMQERVELLNGKLSIVASENSGTKIAVTCHI